MENDMNTVNPFVVKDMSQLNAFDRIRVDNQCDSFFLQVNRTKAAKPIFNKLVKECGLPSKYDPEIWMFITAVGKTLKGKHKGFRLTLKSTNYSTSNIIRKKDKLRASRAKTVALVLASLGYIDFYLGCWDNTGKDSHMSCVLFNGSFTSLFSDKLVSLYKKNISDKDLVVVRDRLTKEDITNQHRYKGINLMRDKLHDYNEELSKHTIRVKDVLFIPPTYKRVCSGDLEHGGRFYTFGGWQTMKSELRPYITIDGEVVTECDIRSNHLSILYTLHGLVMGEDFDGYIVDTDETFTYAELRLLCKKAIMCMINCNSKVGAIGALYSIIKKDKKSGAQSLSAFYGYSKKFFSGIIKKLTEKHSKITFFQKDVILWEKLQHFDSSVSDIVMTHFTKKGEVALGYHDSWVVRASLQEELISVIKKAWKKVFGTVNNCYIKTEY